MPHRLAAIVALLAFVLCLAVGQLEAGNPFTTTVGRALAAMGGTYVVGWIVGLMGRRAIEENLAAAKLAAAATVAAAAAPVVAEQPKQPPPPAPVKPRAGRRR
jgi:peptidoglycan/LPS O-acetylase OafA/YrhL